MFPFPVLPVPDKMFFSLQLKATFFSIAKTYACSILVIYNCTLVIYNCCWSNGKWTIPLTVQRADACLNKKEQNSDYLPQCCSIIYP
jgi:hypothetical protein